MDNEKRPVLAYLDGSETDVAVTAFAAALAAELDCRLILARSVRPPLQPLFVPADELPHWCAPELDRAGEAVRNAEAELALLDRSVCRDNVSRMLLVSSRPCARLLTWLETNPVSFIVGASYLRPGVSRFVGPSVLDRVAQSGLAQVMTLGFQTTGPDAGAGIAPRVAGRRRARCRRRRRLTRP
jgi:hypothetical protein